MRGRLARLGLLAVVALSVAGCYPTSPSDVGTQIHSLYTLFFVASIIVLAFVWVPATIALVRFRRRKTDRALPKQIGGNMRLELLWTAFPLITVLVLFGFTYVTINAIAAEPPNPGATVDVTAFRWGWTFKYPNDNIAITGGPNENPTMVVPVGEPIHISITSIDVDHSFYIPQFLFKRDAIPNHTTTFDFTVQEAGTYRGQCAEFCGVFHAAMLFSVQALPPAQYDQWLASHRGQQ